MTLNTYRFKYQLSDWTLFSISCRLQVLGFGLDSVSDAQLPPVSPGSEGLLLRSMPMPPEQPPSVPRIDSTAHHGQQLLRYVVQRFPRYYIDMAGKDFDAYKAKFSGKTRSTLARRVKKFADATGGALHWERFVKPDDLERFWHLARDVSAKTYQERLLDAGLPDSVAYREQALQLASLDQLRAFLLFDGERPVSYLFCPVHEGVIQYAYLGYDPDYKHFSVGTVLQWLALESLFQEARYRYFDFTEGESEHKRLFATDYLKCANVALLRPTLRNRLVTYSHLRFTQGSEALGRWAERHGWKKRIRNLLRFGRAA